MINPLTVANMAAFHNSQSIKDYYLDRVRNRKSGARASHADWLDLWEREIGIPAELAYLQQEIFENLPRKTAAAWSYSFFSAIRPGADLSLVWSRFVAWLLADSSDGVINCADTISLRAAIGKIARLSRNHCRHVDAWNQALAILNDGLTADVIASRWKAAAVRAAWGENKASEQWEDAEESARQEVQAAAQRGEEFETMADRECDAKAVELGRKSGAAWAAEQAAQAATCAARMRAQPMSGPSGAAHVSQLAARALASLAWSNRPQEAQQANWADKGSIAAVACANAYLKQSEKLLELLRAA